MNRDILNDIINEFEPEKFIRFFRAKNSSFSPRQEALNQYNDGSFKNGQKIGDIKFQDNSLIICTFQVLQPLSEKGGKRLQYEKGKKILKETQSDAGIFIFYDQGGNFRFSLIYANYLGRRRDWSTFRRFTYFVSKEFTNKTFLQRIGDGDFSNIEKIKEAFSVEKVTKAFYTDIANWYFWAVQNVTFPKDAEEEENGRNIAVIRLITRLIFIWFMRERGLISRDLFDLEKVKASLEDLSSRKSTYYKAILQNLFFATLNTKTKDRKYRFQDSFQGKNKDYMDHSIYRYENYFRDKEVMLAVFKDIPFLNGGLFDCLDRRLIEDGKNVEIRIDGFTDKEVGLKVPNFLFFSDLTKANLNQEYGTKNKKYDVRGIISILSTYNFTIDENDPNDQEVALDPELLGKVFENLLASFNPETASTARKATGSYYTPREIVDYMVTQSLKNYLKTNLEEINQVDEKLENLLSNNDEANPFDKQETLKLVRLIDELRVVDPAVGSGAFPMGILNKLVLMLSKLDPNNTLWKEAQITAVEVNITDPIIRRKLKDQIEEQFAQKNFDYGRKLYLIQKCLYGVDIQQIAVEIAKLRFFISLLIDEKIDKNRENWGIEPLPNLDYKMMQGNSLLEEYETINLFDERLLNAQLPDEKKIIETKEKIKNIEKELMQFYSQEPRWMKNPKLERPKELIVIEAERNRLQSIAKDLYRVQPGLIAKVRNQSLFQDGESQAQKVWVELQELHKQLFEPSLARDEKQEIKQKIDVLEWKLIGETLKEQNKIQELEKINKLENSNTKPFFLWKLYFPEVFQEKGGFDIAIGNPPYGDSILNREQMDQLKSYVVHGCGDICGYFVEKELNLLNKKGVFSNVLAGSIVVNKKMHVVRELMKKNGQFNLSFFDTRPARLFPANEERISLVFGEVGNEPILKTSKNYRFTEEQRAVLFDNLSFEYTEGLLLGEEIDDLRHGPKLLPKVGNKINRTILIKLRDFSAKNSTIKDYLTDKSMYKLQYRRSGGYWLNAMDKFPYRSSKIANLFFQSKEVRDFVKIIMNSSLFYFFWITYGNNRDLNAVMIEPFPIPELKILENQTTSIYKLSEELENYLNNSFIPETGRMGEFRMGKIKKFIDETDKFLSDLYGLTPEETEYIIGYDSHIRVSNRDSN